MRPSEEIRKYEPSMVNCVDKEKERYLYLNLRIEAILEWLDKKFYDEEK